MLQSGAYLGEVGMLLHCPAEATFRCLTHVEVFAMPREDLEDIFTSEPEAANVSRAACPVPRPGRLHNRSARLCRS